MTRGTCKGEENDIGFMWDLHIEARCFADFKKWQQSKACRGMQSARAVLVTCERNFNAQAVLLGIKHCSVH
jgi:hypothetical protein